MSCVREFRNFILSQMKNTPTELKKETANFLNTLDSDLDVGGFEQSSELDKAVEALNNAIISLDTPEENANEEESIEIPIKLPVGEKGYREISNDGE